MRRVILFVLILVVFASIALSRSAVTNRDAAVVDKQIRARTALEMLPHRDPHAVTPTAAQGSLCFTGSIPTDGIALGVEVRGDFAYVGDFTSGLQIIDVSDRSSPTIVGQYDTPGLGRMAWLVDSLCFVPDWDGGLQIIDISNPALPTLAGSIGTDGLYLDVVVEGNYAFVADYHSNGPLDIIDISDVSNPVLVGSYTTPHRAEGVAVSGDYAYLAAGSEGLYILDISNKTAPELVGSYNTPGEARNVKVAGDFCYLASGYNGVFIFNVSDPTTPVLVGSQDTSGYAYDIKLLGDRAYVADRLKGIVVLDISDPSAPTIVATFPTLRESYGIAPDGEYIYIADYSTLTILCESGACAAPCIIGVCGNGIREPGEECDDGNLISGDGCDANCIDDSPVCGNGILEQGEECDDGNLISGDGCSSTCRDSLYEDLSILAAGLNSAVPGNPTMYGISVQNIGDVSIEAEVLFSLPLETTYILSTPPGTYIDSSREVSWSLGMIDPGTTTWFQVQAYVLPGTAPGTVISGTALVLAIPNDDAPSDNVDTFDQIIAATAVPYKKSVTPVGIGPDGLISRFQTLTYQISFQNVGNDSSYTVVVYDTLNPNLDPTSLVLGPSSHSNVLTINGSELVWTFNSIDLPGSVENEPASHGFVEFSIQLIEFVLPLSPIENFGTIAFESDPPVYTDTVLNTIDETCLVTQTGDVNSSNTITSADIIFLVNYIFKSSSVPIPCAAVGDVNCSGAVTSADIIYTVNYVFLRGGSPCDVCVLIPSVWSCP